MYHRDEVSWNLRLISNKQQICITYHDVTIQDNVYTFKDDIMTQGSSSFVVMMQWQRNLAGTPVLHHTDPIVLTLHRIGIIHECNTGNLLIGVVTMHHDDKGA